MANLKLGTQIDKLYKMKVAVDLAKIALAKSKEAKALARLEKKFKEESEKMFQSLPREQLDGASGKVGVVSITSSKVGSVEDWNQLYKFIKRTNGFDLLNRAFNNKAYRERLENGKKVPGVKTATIHSMSIRKKPGAKL